MIKIDNLSQSDSISSSSGRSEKGSKVIDFKNLFLFISKEMTNISKALADDSEYIYLKGQKLKKGSAETLFVIQQYTNELENTNSLAMDLMNKAKAFDDQASRIIGS